MSGASRVHGHSLAWVGRRVAPVLLGLLLVSTMARMPGLAAFDTNQHHSHTARAAIEAAPTVAHTVFVPLAISQSVTPNVWNAEYFSNAGLLGPPAYTQEDAYIDYDWEDGSPKGLPDNRFSIRWTGDWEFEVGVYTFFVYADDGVRLWLDGEKLVDAWQPGMGEHDRRVTVTTAGLHRVRVEYFEHYGDASIEVHWRRTDLYPQWVGEYFSEPWVEHGKQYEQTDSVIQFAWGEGCPDDLPPNSCDRFSIRWEAEPLFEPGEHRIYLYADQGYELYVDDEWRGDEGWDSGESSKDDYYNLNVADIEYHEIRYNFHDQGGSAEARLWIENLAHPRWTAKYYNNRNLSGTPVVTEPDPVVFYDWKLGKPHRDLPSDRFSVQWSGERYFHAGFYRFGFFADDGVKLTVDGEVLVDEWHDGRAEYHSALTFLGTGYHDVIIEYYDNVGGAEIRFWWE